MRRPITERFWEKVKKTDGCWLWTASCSNSKTAFSYGKLFIEERGGVPKFINAHRFSWILHRGKIRDSECVLHRCDNPRCVNPDHLFLGTKADNMIDMWDKGRRKRKTHCPQGHPYSGANLGISKGRIFCRACNYLAARKRQHERFGRPLTTPTGARYLPHIGDPSR